MAKQEVNTDRIATAATNLRNINNNINSRFSSLKRKAEQLNTNWQSPAGEVARTTMYKLFKYSEARSAVIQNYINMLEQQINPGYINAETTNKLLADKFK